MNFNKWKERNFENSDIPLEDLKKAYAEIAVESNAIYAISADPPTWGHADIMMRASKKFSKVFWIVGVNSKKQSIFSSKDKVDMMNHYINYYKIKNVHVEAVEGSTVKYAESKNALFLIRGLRSSSDYQYEFELSVGNRGISKEIETICMFSKPHYATISSSIVRELAMLGEGISQYVHPEVEKIVKSKFK